MPKINNYFKFIVSFNGLMSNEGSLFVVVIAPIEGIDEQNATGLTVTLGGGNRVPIGHLTRYFITSECPALAQKPKMLFFFDPQVTCDAELSSQKVGLQCATLFTIYVIKILR